MEKRFVVVLLFSFILSIPSAFSLPFTFHISEQYYGVHTENLWPCWDKKLSLELGGVFQVYDARFRAGYLTGVCDHYHRFAGGIKIVLGDDDIDDVTVRAVCSKCGYPWKNGDFGGQYASRVDVCGGDDNGGKMTWGGWGGYPYEFTYNRQNEIGRVDRDEISYLGAVDDFFDEYSALKNEDGWRVTVSTDHPEVMIWIGDDPAVTQATDTSLIVAACADTNQNDQCDFEETSFSNCVGAGGDWYRGECCGVDHGECEFVDSVTKTVRTYSGYIIGALPDETVTIEINALCGKNAAGDFEWAAVDEPGEIHELFDCPGGSVISDGTNLNQCGGDPHDDTTEILQKGFKTVSVNGFMHDYFCIGKTLYECGGSGTPFSSINSRFTGAIAPGSATTCPSDLVGYWPMDGNTQDIVFGNNGVNTGATFGLGQVGQAAIFTGDGRITVASTPVLNPNELTIEAWINIPADQTAGTNTIVHKNNAYQLVVKDGILQGAIQTEGGPTWTLAGTGNVPTNTWTHVAMIYTGSDLSFYINGNEMDSIPLSGDIQSSTSLLFIGEASDAINFPSQFAFHGSIDEVAIYDGIALPADLAQHYSSPENYCPTVSFGVAETYYCASDGDWTKDLDIKDKESCDLSGYEGTGTYCCSEDDDPEEYYNDPLGTAKSIEELIIDEGGNVERTGDNLTLDDSGSWARFDGPAQLHIYEWSERERTAGEFETCKFLGKTFVGIPAGDSKFVYVVEPSTSDPANTNCTLRRKEIVVESTPGYGGCWDKNVVDSGNYAPQTNQKVLNYLGQFYGCNVTDPALLALTDYHVAPPADADDPTDQLINNSVQRCGYVFYDASGDAAEPNLVCGTTGNWETTDALIGEFEKGVRWTLPINITGISNTGCCAADQCWNGTECQTLHSYYRVLDQGYVCEFAEDVPTVDLPPPPSMCTDSDGGKDYSVEGATQPGGWEPEDTDACIEIDDNNVLNEVDECIVADIKQEGGKCALRETYCDGDMAKYELVTCYDCKDGVCNVLP